MKFQYYRFTAYNMVPDGIYYAEKGSHFALLFGKYGILDCTLDNNSILYIKDRQLHREDGPSFIVKEGHLVGDAEFWYLNGEHRLDVEDWIEDNNFPHSNEWTDEHRVLFKLNFG